MGRRSDIDWDPIQRDWETDLLTGAELATKYGVDRASIARKAKAQGWQRNITDRVRERTAAKLLTTPPAPSPTPGKDKATKQQSNAGNPDSRPSATPPAPANQADPVDVAAAANVSVILNHRSHIAKARGITERLLMEAEAQFEDALTVLPVLAGKNITVGDKALTAAELERIRTALARARDLPTRASTIKTLTEAMRLQQGLERQAFGIDKGDGGAGEDNTDFRQRLLDARARALSTRG